MYNLELGIIQSLKRIFAGVIIGHMSINNPMAKDKAELFGVLYSRFVGNFPINIFQDEYAIFYDILVRLKAKVFDLSQLETIIYNNRDLILESPYVDLKNYETTIGGTPSTDDEKIEAFRINMIEAYKELADLFVTEEEFNTACIIYVDWYKEKYMLQTAQNMSQIMNLGLDEKKPGGRSRKYLGFNDAQVYYTERMKVLSSLSEDNRIVHSKLDAEWLEEQQENENSSNDDCILDFGIPELDNTLGSLRRSNMLGILGPPKGGKTRFSSYLVSRAVRKGLNVCIWPLEGTKDEWVSMQVAGFIRSEVNVSMSSTDILTKKYLDNKLHKSYVMSAKTSLATDPKLGKISYITGTAYCEDFLDVLQNHYDTENPFDVLVIDSLVNIQSKNRVPKSERISEAYMELKNFIANRLKIPALAIMPSQLKQDAVDKLRNNPDDTIDVTAGGESAETVRTPDEVVGLFSSKEERAANITHIYSVASRHSGNFPDCMVKTDFQCCHFYSDPNQDLNK